MIDKKTQKRFEPILEEFRNGIAHHRAKGTTESRIRSILTASVRLAVEQVEDPELCVWLCDRFTEAAKVAPIVPNHGSSQKLH
jgi:hypothetical protein